MFYFSSTTILFISQMLLRWLRVLNHIFYLLILYISRFKGSLYVCLLQITGYSSLCGSVEDLRKKTFDSDDQDHESMLLNVSFPKESFFTWFFFSISLAQVRTSKPHLISILSCGNCWCPRSSLIPESLNNGETLVSKVMTQRQISEEWACWVWWTLCE